MCAHLVSSRSKESALPRGLRTLRPQSLHGLGVDPRLSSWLLFGFQLRQIEGWLLWCVRPFPKARSSTSALKESSRLLLLCTVTTAFWTLLLLPRRWYGLAAGGTAGAAAGVAPGPAAGAAAGGTG